MNFSPELRMRVVSGAILIAAVVLAVTGGPIAFALLVSLCAFAALREWHRLVNAGGTPWEALPTIAALIGTVGLILVGAAEIWIIAAFVAGTLATVAVALVRKSWAFWHSFGMVYVGVPTVALLELHPIRGGIVIGGVFAAVWAADIGALTVGKLLGGPRLAPQLSPNKTWSGLVGGIALAGVTELVYVAIMGGTAWQGILFGVLLGIAANCGDLFESWVKRVFRTKNSGNLIPGHGGMLDRIDSLLFAAPIAAAFLLGWTGNSIFGTNT